MQPIARIIDANANRAREALRVMEDVSRFAFNDAALTAELKSLRHELRAALDRLPFGWLEANRDVVEDVGTDIKAASERSRAGLDDVAAAAGKRLSEALRVIEESSKTFDSVLAASIEAIRYRGYDLDRRLRLRGGTGRARQWRLCVLVTESLCCLPWLDVVRAAIDGGVDCIQLREKELEGGELARRAEQVIALAKPRDVSVIVNDRVDVALTAGADGVHIGQGDLSMHQVRAIAGMSLLVGVSTHDLSEARAAIEAGADCCGVGAMFASGLKPGREPSGAAYLRAFIERYPSVPHLAIGGITPDNVSELVDAGARGVAVSSCVCGADRPGEVVAALRRVVEPAAVFSTA